MEVAEQHLTQISSAVHHGCMGLPQELIDCIADTLHDDLHTLKACSLTCKAMFASTRHLIHQTLHLTRRNNEKVLAREEVCQSFDYRELRLLSYMGECGLLKYTRQIHVRDPGTFIPDTLLPHIHYFQSLDRVHTLTIEHYDAVLWARHHKTCFVHFYPTLTSLTLSRPFGRCQELLRFAQQFPKLENLCFEWLRGERDTKPGFSIPDMILQSSRGHLRLAFGAVIQPSEDFLHAHELQNGINFGSVEFESDFYDNHAQHMVNTCGHSLESLSISSPGARYSLLYCLKLTKMTVLRRLTCRMPFHLAIIIKADALVGMFSTVKSPFFCEFVLELSALPSQFDARRSEDWGRWRAIDEFLEEKFAKCGDFKVIIRTGERCSQAIFQRCTKEGFPLLVKRGCVYFEGSHD